MTTTKKFLVQFECSDRTRCNKTDAAIAQGLANTSEMVAGLYFEGAIPKVTVIPEDKKPVAP